MDEILLKQLLDCVAENDDDEDIDLLFSSDSSDTSESHEHAKIYNFVETIDSYNDRDFKEHFRLNRDTVLDLIVKYQTYNEREVSSGRPMLEQNVDIYMYLWYLSNTVTFRQLGNLFGVAKSTSWNVIVRVAEFFMSISNEQSSSTNIPINSDPISSIRSPTTNSSNKLKRKRTNKKQDLFKQKKELLLYLDEQKQKRHKELMDAINKIKN